MLLDRVEPPMRVTYGMTQTHAGEHTYTHVHIHIHTLIHIHIHMHMHMHMHMLQDEVQRAAAHLLPHVRS